MLLQAASPVITGYEYTRGKETGNFSNGASETGLGMCGLEDETSPAIFPSFSRPHSLVAQERSTVEEAY